MNQFGDRSAEVIWEKLSQVAVMGAEYDSPERRPHPRCLKDTRVKLLDGIYDLLDDQKKNQLIWLNGTAGVGKSAVAFTVAARMRGLKAGTQADNEMRLAGTFFFSRKYTNRCTTGYFFATLAYQLATNFPSIQDDLTTAIRKNPALLNPGKSLRNQMEALFLQPLRRLQIRLRRCQPLVFVVDALDECTSKEEIIELISLLGEALHDPDLPATKILLTSRSEGHIREAIREEEMHLLVYEIPAENSSATAVISLDGADVDSDICIFLKHSFTKLQHRCPNFPQPTEHELVQLASRAGRRFIVAFTMINFIDDEHNHDDPRDRLQLMLQLTCKQLPGMEVYKLYDLILSTCSDPKRAYMHLSVVAALANPLPVSQISELLGPGEGKDVEIALVQLRSVMDIPTDRSLPVNIYHSSIRDYVSSPSNCVFFEEEMISSHTLLAYSSLKLMIRHLRESTGLLDALLELRKQSQAMGSQPPRSLMRSLGFIVEPPTALRVIIALLWLRGNRSPPLYPWLKAPDGCAWLCTPSGREWLDTPSGREWLQIPSWLEWLHVPSEWLDTPSGPMWPDNPSGLLVWLETPSGREWLETSNGREWLGTSIGQEWLETSIGQEWLQTESAREWLETSIGREWLQTESAREWLQSSNAREWLQTQNAREWLHTSNGREWLQTPNAREWLQTSNAREWLQTPSAREWLQNWDGREWLQTRDGREWLQTREGGEWLQTRDGREWLQTPDGREWLQIPNGGELYQTTNALECPQPMSMQEWVQTSNGRQWLQTRNGREWLRTPNGREWLQTPNGREWLQTPEGRVWLQTPNGREWVQTSEGREWLQTPEGREWLQTRNAREWLQTPNAREWLQTANAQEWLQTWNGREWLQTLDGREWLQTLEGREWLQTLEGREWLQTPEGREWLQTPSAREWLQTRNGREWQSTPAASVWVHMEGFLDTVEAINKFIIIPELSLLPAFQVIQQFKSLSDFLILPVLLSSTTPQSPTSALVQSLDMDIIHAIKAFVSFTNEVWEWSQSVSHAVMYACQNWVMHLSQAPNPWNNMLNLKHVFKVFCDVHLLSWLEMQWCLTGLRSCLIVLSEMQDLGLFKNEDGHDCGIMGDVSVSSCSCQGSTSSDLSRVHAQMPARRAAGATALVPPPSTLLLAHQSRSSSRSAHQSSPSPPRGIPELVLPRPQVAPVFGLPLEQAKSRTPSHASDGLTELDPEEDEVDEPICKPGTSAKGKQKNSGPAVVANLKDPGQPTTSSAYQKRKVALEPLEALSKTQKRSRK